MSRGELLIELKNTLTLLLFPFPSFMCAIALVAPRVARLVLYFV
jgi:hypothetical protein